MLNSLKILFNDHYDAINVIVLSDEHIVLRFLIISHFAYLYQAITSYRLAKQ